MKNFDGGRAEFKQAKQLTEELSQVAQIPGGLEMLVTMAAKKLGPGSGKSKQLRLYDMGEGGYADGGLAQAAEMTRQGGRGGDEVLLHVSPEEYEALTGMWGQPDVNPQTGLPEYGFLSKLWKGVKKTVKKIVSSPLFSFIAPIALNIFAPGLGSAIGGWLGATGKAAAVIGNTALRAGVGAVSGGKDGAISGALSGLVASGVGSDIGGKLGMSGNVGKIAGDALLGGAAGTATGVGFQQGALGQGMASFMGNPAQKMEDKLTEFGRGIFRPEAGGINPDAISGPGEFGMQGVGFDIPTTDQVPLGDTAGVLSGSSSMAGPLAQAGANPSLWNRASGWMREHPWLTAGGALLAGSALSGRGGSSGSDSPPQLPPNFTTSLPNLSFDRSAMPDQDYFNYGRASSASPGEASFFSGNSISGLPPAPAPVGGSPSGGSGPGPAPFVSRGSIADFIRIAQLTNQGWTYDQVSKTAYPPGTFGIRQARGGLVAAYRLGGLVRKYQSGGHVRGPGTGRSDEIPAVLSDGEYVMDSETVALLGDGSTDAGARRLDEMRKKLRKHKAKKLSRGGFSDAAKAPEEYMAEGGEVKQKKGALGDLKRLAVRLEQAIESGNKKRVGEITATLKSLDGGDKILAGFARGGSVKRIMASLERTVESSSAGSVEGSIEKRLRGRRQVERGKDDGRRVTTLSEDEKVKLAEELGGFKPNSRFIRNLKKSLKKEKEKT